MCVLQLFNGTFGHVLERAGGDVQALIQRLEHFYSKVYSSLIIKPFFYLISMPGNKMHGRVLLDGCKLMF